MGSLALWGIWLWQLFCQVDIPFLIFKPICCITSKVNEYPSYFNFCLWMFRWMLLWNKSLQRALSKDNEQHSSVHFGKNDSLTFREVVTMSENVYKVISVMPGRKSPSEWTSPLELPGIFLSNSALGRDEVFLLECQFSALSMIELPPSDWKNAFYACIFTAVSRKAA
jgi:hypothetical protein